ncbi:hypothetical protein [Alterisphingorhabdus coralli]|uniref:Uncharacterized protein n=1 Tax=Alterisphingorhabdus coralli TaxID=3071408 RepID=A0AA97I305_9SPHN|nr:hypothetical protein [Parasphingorhabdus sp. SCSIO 66989]WOE76265.1 hypothetical protein RB602_06005 [Parasphingorhabdus sp. SCSIO 66989]
MEPLAYLLTQGGDERITLDPETGTNRYYATPYPRDTVAYASSTANDISNDAWAHLQANWPDLTVDSALDGAGYAEALDAIRSRLLQAYDLDADSQVIFAASGTDLEYIALLAAAGDAGQPVHNILLGADEVGSGCIYSAQGQYFAAQTSLGIASVKGEPVEGLPPVTLSEIPVRDSFGMAHDSITITSTMRDMITLALQRGQKPLLHVVHGSKTGLILPDLNEVDALRAEYGDRIAFVVDACQARITSSALRAYLERDMLVLLTGSKFMGGPPFNGFAIVPGGLMRKAAALPLGYQCIFRRAEWPAQWPGRDALPDSGNLGLILRLSASIFELERFQQIAMEDITRIVRVFQKATAALVEQIGGCSVLPYAPDHQLDAITHPIEMQTLVTFDLNRDHKGERMCFATAAAIHKQLMDHGVRLGQPVRCRSIASGDYAGTLRIGLSMPQMVHLAKLDDAALAETLAGDMESIAKAYHQVTREPMAAV